ncbi:MAG: LysE family transporter [Pseudomonadota bacterium]
MLATSMADAAWDRRRIRRLLVTQTAIRRRGLINNLYLVVVAFGIGLTLAIPTGPVNILAVQRALTHGFAGGVAVGVGAAIGDTLLAFVAVTGLAYVTVFLTTFASELQVAGGAILILFGLGLARNRLTASPALPNEAETHRSAPAEPARFGLHARAVPQAFIMTVTNPGAMLGAFALVGGLASIFGALPSTFDVALVIAAIAAGNLTWWIVMTYTVSRLRTRV